MMTDLFEDDDSIISDDAFKPEEHVDIDASEILVLDARRRLEQKLEEKRLRDELDDFIDY
jgi:hypothetical protein